MSQVALKKVQQNLKLLKVMRATNYTDDEIASALSIKLKDFLEVINQDEYIKYIYDKASEKILDEIEKLFLENVMKRLKSGDNTDAKWILERRNSKYSNKSSLDVNITSIDDIIKENSSNKDKDKNNTP